MSKTIRVPESLDGATIAFYPRREGDPFAVGDSLATLTLDERSVDIVADEAGVLLRLLLKRGMNVGEGAPLLVVGTPGEQLGWDPAQIRSVRVTILRRCEECGNEYPLNGLTDRVRCTGCGESQRVSPAFWQDYVAEPLGKAELPGEGAANNILAGKHGKATITCVGIPPLCRKCFTVLDWEAVHAAWGRAQQGPTEVACIACGEAHQARLPPDWARALFPKIVFLLGETVSSGPQESKPVVFKCPSCMAALQIDGRKRIVRCSFCDSDIYMPDDLWTSTPRASAGAGGSCFSPDRSFFARRRARPES